MSPWPANSTYFWERAPFFRILLPFAAGICVYYMGWLPSGIPLVWVTGAAAALLLPLALLLLRQQSTAVRTATYIVVNLLLFCAGVSVSAFNDVRNNAMWYGHHLSKDRVWLARITATPSAREKSWKLQVAMIRASDSTGVMPVTGKAFVYIERTGAALGLAKGDSILLPGNWERLADAGNPFEFSYATHCARNNIYYRQWCKAGDVALYAPLDPRRAPITDRAHDWSMAQLARYLGADRARGLLQAMILGDEINLDEDLRQAYADTGIVHIIAISGGNISIFFIVVAFLLGWIRHRKYLWIKYAVALPIIWFYVLMAGAQPSAMRAAVMFSVLAFGIMMQKNKNGLNQLMAAAFTLLCSEPAWLFSIGFQLSFVAVLSILLFFKPVYELLPITGRKVDKNGPRLLKVAFAIGNAFGSVVSMSIAAELLVAPLVMYYFHTYPIMFALANVAAFIFMSITLVAGVVLVAVSLFPFVATLLASFIIWLVRIFGFIVGHLQGAGPRSFKFLMITGYETIVFYIIIAGVTTFILRRRNQGLLVGLSAACLLLLSLCVGEWQRLHREKLVVYNVGNATHIDYMAAGRYRVMLTDTAARKKINYAIRPAHIGWRSWEGNDSPQHDILTINGKTVLVLNDRIKGTVKFPVDYLVLHTPRPDMKRLFHNFSPRMVVLAGGYSPRQVSYIAAGCSKAGVPLHTVDDMGAFVLSN